MTGFREMQSGGYQPALSAQADAESMAEAKARRERTDRKALENLAHYATDAEEYRMFADALGLPLDLLRKDDGDDPVS